MNFNCTNKPTAFIFKHHQEILHLVCFSDGVVNSYTAADASRVRAFEAPHLQGRQARELSHRQDQYEEGQGYFFIWPPFIRH